MQQFIIKPLRRSQWPWCPKKFKQIQKTYKNFLKIADIKILKTIPLHLEAMQ